MKNLFTALLSRRVAAAPTVQPQQPRPLSAAELARVGGGSPNGTWATTSSPNGTW